MDNTTELQKNQKEKICSDTNFLVNSIQKVHDSTQIQTQNIPLHAAYEISTILSISKQTDEEITP